MPSEDFLHSLNGGSYVQDVRYADFAGAKIGKAPFQRGFVLLILAPSFTRRSCSIAPALPLLVFQRAYTNTFVLVICSLPKIFK